MSDGDHPALPSDALCPVSSDTVASRLLRLARAQHAMLAADLEQIGLYPGQENALANLWEHGSLTQTKLAALVGVDASTICRTLQRLERAGYVLRTPGPDDRRTTVVSPTDSANALRDALADVYDRTEQRLLAALTDDERTQLSGLLQKMLDSLDHSPARTS